MKIITKRVLLSLVISLFLYINTACAVSAPTQSPVASPTVAPTATPTVTPTATPTVAPTATPTVAPTATPTVAPTTIPTATPIPTSDSRFPDIIICDDTIMQDIELLDSLEEADRYFFEKATKGYSTFGMLVKDLSMLRTADEYLELYRDLRLIEIKNVTQYSNGYYLSFSRVEAPIDAVLVYAIRTGDTSFLTEDELQCYHKLQEIADELCLKKLSPIDAVVAAHDYLVRNTAYDTPAFLSGQSTPSHFASGTILTGKAVCSGYASSFRLLMQIAGIPCLYIHNDSHAWNQVQIDQNWYHIDVTWDDPTPDRPGIVSYDFFMMTDAETISLDSHELFWLTDWGDLNSCISTDYRLYPYRDFICTTTAEARDLLIAQRSNEQITWLYPVSGELNQDVLLDMAVNYFNRGLSYYAPVLLMDSYYKLTVLLH